MNLQRHITLASELSSEFFTQKQLTEVCITFGFRSSVGCWASNIFAAVLTRSSLITGTG